MTGEMMLERLREKGLKITPQRLAIIDVLIEKRPFHPGASLIYAEGKKKAKGLSLSTVYATLQEFSRCGLLQTLEFDQRENRYEVNLEEHVNLICQRCGKISDYPSPLFVDQAELTEKTGFLAREARLEYYGHCRDCLGDRAADGRG